MINIKEKLRENQEKHKQLLEHREKLQAGLQKTEQQLIFIAGVIATLTSLDEEIEKEKLDAEKPNKPQE